MQFQTPIFFESIPSTNSYLKENFRLYPHGTVIVAEHQTAGKGRMGRIWHDSDDLLFSVLIKELTAPAEVSKMALAVAAALYLAVRPYVPGVAIKWPNDLVVGYRKLAGVLLESVITQNRMDCLIIGIGINCNTRTFPEELTSQPTSLAIETGSVIDKRKLLQEILIELDRFYQDFRNKDETFLAICRNYSCLIGKEVIFNDYVSDRTGTVVSILDNGNILLDVGGKVSEYNSGEVTLRTLYQKNK